MTRFAKPSDTLSINQKRVISSFGESHIRPANAVPHRLIAGPMHAPRYKPPKWVAPIR